MNVKNNTNRNEIWTKNKVKSLESHCIAYKLKVLLCIFSVLCMFMVINTREKKKFVFSSFLYSHTHTHIPFCCCFCFWFGSLRGCDKKNPTDENHFLIINSEFFLSSLYRCMCSHLLLCARMVWCVWVCIKSNKGPPNSR